MKRLFIIYVFLLAVFSVMAEDEKLRIAVFDPESQGISFDGNMRITIRELISSTLVNTGKYEIVERSLLEKVMKEQQFSQSGAVDDSQITEIGKLAGANKVIISIVTSVDDRNMLSVRLIDVKTASVERQKVKVVTSGELLDVVESLTLELVSEKATSTSPVVSEKATSTPPISSAKKSFVNRRVFSNSPKNERANTPSGLSQSTLDPSKMQVSGKDFIEYVNGIQIKMIYVEGGNFLMGATEDQGKDISGDEKPVRQVTVDSYYIGAFEVTQGQWEKIMEVTLDPKKYDSGYGSDYPIYHVSWEEVDYFCRKLSKLTGKKYKLPTEAQWEYAARGGQQKEGTMYSGETFIDAVAYYSANSDKHVHPVGGKAPNALGIYDMSGNLWEWCQDYFDKYRKKDNTNNPTGPVSGKERVYRGGSYRDKSTCCRVAFRVGTDPKRQTSTLGFRLVMIP